MEADELNAAEAELGDVEHALDRLDDGSYATCDVCGDALGDDRLQSHPAARTCARHG